MDFRSREALHTTAKRGDRRRSVPGERISLGQTELFPALVFPAKYLALGRIRIAQIQANGGPPSQEEGALLIGTTPGSGNYRLETDPAEQEGPSWLSGGVCTNAAPTQGRQLYGCRASQLILACWLAFQHHTAAQGHFPRLEKDILNEGSLPFSDVRT